MSYLRLSAIFSDGMMLERDTAFNMIWGYTRPDAEVRAELSGCGFKMTGETAGDIAGFFQIQLPQRPAGGPYELTIVSGEEKKVIKDILFGEIFLLGGQSNMELSIGTVSKDRAELPDIDKNYIRAFTFEKKPVYSDPSDMLSEGRWIKAEGKSLNDFSAVGLYAAVSLYEKLEVPVGLYQTAIGGSPISSWLSENSVMRLSLDADRLMAVNESGEGDLCSPTAGFYGSLYPLQRQQIKAVLFYQGESNVERHETYRSEFAAMTADWRRLFRNPELPFFYVQLAGYGEGIRNCVKTDWSVFRDVQLQCESIQNTYMVQAYDLGDQDDIHPADKKPLGERLADAVYSVLFGNGVYFKGPGLSNLRLDGKKAVLDFSTLGGLVNKNISEETVGFSLVFIKDGEEMIEEISGKLDTSGGKKRVVIDIPEGRLPEEIRYAWNNYPYSASLYDSYGLPAVPFRIPV